MRRSSSRDLPKSIGRYEVVSLLGTGAMGRVALAHDPVLDRDVAIKLLRTDIAVADDVREGLVLRMQHEARAAARVSHPNLVVLHDMGEDEDAGLFLVFEYVEGPTLKQRIEQGPIKRIDVARLARELGQALRFAHDAGVLHRDVKPDNVILSTTGSKLVDFGIARVPDSTLTHQGGLLGTPAYSAPETFRAGTFSPASDQFSLAATMYEAVYNERAFPGDDAVAVASRIAHDEPERRSARAGLPEAVDDVLARGLAKDPEGRFPSCEAFGRALEAALGGSMVVAATPSSPRASPHGSSTRKGESAPSSLPPPPPRRPHQVVLGAIVVLAAGIAVGRGLFRPAPPDASATEAAIRDALRASAEAERVQPPPGPALRRPRAPRATNEPVAPLPAAPLPSTSASGAASASVPPPSSSPAIAADAGPPPGDAGPTADAGAPRADAGTARADAGLHGPPAPPAPPRGSP